MNAPSVDQLAKWIADGLDVDWDALYPDYAAGKKDHWKRNSYVSSDLTQADLRACAALIIIRMNP